MKTKITMQTLAMLVLMLGTMGHLIGQGPCATPSNLSATPAVVCPGGTSNLNATSAGNIINWYTVSSGGVSIGNSASGSNFAVNPSVTTTYYAEAVGITGGTQTFNYTGSIQNFTVPTGVTSLTIEAIGAQGGTSTGGKGARMIGTFAVTPGDVLGIVVGQQGIVNNCGGANASGGGGGGSFVWLTTSSALPMIAAGGGGGANQNWGGIPCTFGIDAVTTPDGTQGNGSTSALGGTGGNGGFGNAPSGTGSGGGGWLSAGQNSTWGSGCTGGLGAFLFTGGYGASAFGPGGEGGFGGGGGAVCGCGGGGGYSGGGGGEGSICRAGGGGGGSYNVGTSQSNTPGYQTGNGIVIFTWASSTCTTSVRVPVTVTMDNVAPVANCQPVTVVLDQFGIGTATGAAVNNSSTDNCTISTMTLDQGSFNCSSAPTTTVTLTVTDNSGNSSTCTSIVTIQSSIVLSSSVVADTFNCNYNVSCAGATDGEAQASGVGGCPGYTYLWSNGQTTATATGLGAGTYTVTITDGTGATSVGSVTLTAPAQIQLSPITSGTCFGEATGTIYLSPSGGNDCQGYTYLWSNGPTTEDQVNLAAGSYTVTVTDAEGCTKIQTLTVTSVAALNPTISQAGNTFTSVQTWVTYQWLLNGSNISGANSNTYTATGPGTYSLMVTDSNGCSAVSADIIIVGINDPMGNWMGLTLYPNPARGEFRLQTATPIGYEITVGIHDLFGRRLFAQTLPDLGREVAFDIHGLAAGTYFVEVTSEEGQRRLFRLVVE